MQGRLVKSEKKGRIQYFPAKQWINEINLASKNSFNIMEWTANIENIELNPIFDISLKKKYLNILRKNKIQVKSLTCDFFMQRPFFKKGIDRDKNLKILEKVIKNCEILKINYIILPLVDNSSVKTKLEENNLKFTLMSMLRNKKLMILFESDYKPKKLKQFINKFPDNFGINYDTGNSSSLNYDFLEEKKYFNRVFNIHIKDRKKFGETVRLGNGNWNYRKFFNNLSDKKNMSYILQTAPPKKSENRLNEILLNREFLIKCA